MFRESSPRAGRGGQEVTAPGGVLHATIAQERTKG
jgi:hypothetical protein